MAARSGTPVVEDSSTDDIGVNEVRLVGRVSGEPESRTMPSGDEVVMLRVVVRRPPEPGGARASAAKTSAKTSRSTVAPDEVAAKASPRPTVDTIDVSCWTPVTRRAGLRLAAGEQVEVEGALRRRFYRAGPTVQSRYDVVATRVRRVGRARP